MWLVDGRHESSGSSCRTDGNWDTISACWTLTSRRLAGDARGWILGRRRVNFCKWLIDHPKLDRFRTVERYNLRVSLLREGCPQRNIPQRFFRAEMIGFPDGLLPFGRECRGRQLQTAATGWRREPVGMGLMETDQGFEGRGQFGERIRARKGARSKTGARTNNAPPVLAGVLTGSRFGCDRHIHLPESGPRH